MKKSEILDAVYLEMANNWAESSYICNNIKDMRARGDFGDDCTPVYELLDWIDYSICANFAFKYGVAAWLFEQGCIDEDTMRNPYHPELIHYRLLWLKDMAAYWKSKGQ